MGGSEVAEVLAIGEPLVEFAALQPGPLEEAEAFRRGWGGDTSNFAVACARLGASVAYLTRVGDDAFGRALRAMWRREGVDDTYVQVAPGEPTGIYFLSRDRNGRHTFTYYRAGSAASRLSPQDLRPEMFEGVRVLHVTGITQAISDSACRTVEAAVELARARGVLVSYDANIRPALKRVELLRDAVYAVMARATFVFLSTEDAFHLFGALPDAEVVGRVLEMGARTVVLKQGAEGCLVATPDDGFRQIPGWSVEPIDTTGAGDAFDAGFVVAWLRGEPLERAAAFANAVGALTTTALGATAAVPTLAQVERFLAERAPEAWGRARRP